MSDARTTAVRPKWWWALLGVCAGMGAGLFLGTLFTTPKPLNLDDPQNWTIIQNYRGVVDPQDGTVQAVVGVVSRLSNEPTEETVLQNKIEVKRSNDTTRFMWPDRISYAAGRCEILDLDGDGKKEFLLLWDVRGVIVRVVAYAHGNFQFRKDLDELNLSADQLGAAQLGGNGHFVFVSDQPFPTNIDAKHRTRIPRLMRWSRSRGFEDVSAKFPEYYSNQYVPKIQEKLRQENDPQLRQTYLDVIKHVQETFIQKR